MQDIQAEAMRYDASTIDRYLGDLTEGHRQVLYLAATGTSYKEMAEIMCIPVGTVRSRLHRANCHLDRLITAEDKEARHNATVG